MRGGSTRSETSGASRGGGSCVAALAILAMGLGPAAVAPPAAAQSVPTVENVQRILVEGNGRVSDATVRAYMTVREGDRATPSDINDSIRRLIDTGLFEDVTIAPMADGLLVQVVEAPSINRVVFEGNDDVSDETLQGVVRSAPRGAFSRAQADADARAMLELYRRTGRYAATVEPVIIERDGNRVDLVFEIDEGGKTGVRTIEFVGNDAFSDSRLRGAIQTTESGFLGWLFSSDVYDPDRLEYDKELLRSYYLERGYADIQVLSATAELTPDREDFVITFTVDEGEIYQFGDIDLQVSLPGLDPETLQGALTMKPGDRYDSGEVDDTIEQLTYQVGLARLRLHRGAARGAEEPRGPDGGHHLPGRRGAARLHRAARHRGQHPHR